MALQTIACRGGRVPEVMRARTEVAKRRTEVREDRSRGSRRTDASEVRRGSREAGGGLAERTVRRRV